MSYTLPTLPYTALTCVIITVNNIQAPVKVTVPVASIYRKMYEIFTVIAEGWEGGGHGVLQTALFMPTLDTMTKYVIMTIWPSRNFKR